ncbi:unnamed protein product [Orchesella dallaii]|uniref:Cell cycle checkpoint control protein RAD9A n=1 Tax=Orchesella dallaii TaxID=48710 RepID=A0ABP1RL42_9HEXA
MKVIVGNAHLEKWTRVLKLLKQFGNQVHLEANDRVLTLSTFNPSMTNYATVLFFRNFFTCCQMNVISDKSEKVVVPVNEILKPYRTLKVAKSYLSSEIKFNPTEDFISVTSEGKTHVSTTYKLCATESSSDVQFDCDPYAMKSFLKADAKVLSSCLSKINHMKELSELTLKIQGQRVMLKNTVTDMARKDGTVVTEYTLTSHDFIEFEVDADSIELAFGFREFKIFTSFAEQLKVPVTIYFQTPNDPVIVTVKTDTFEARLCMVTRIRDPFDMAGTEASGSSVGSNGRISNVASQMPVPSRDVSVEVNRRVERGTLDAQRDHTEEPARKRPLILRKKSNRLVPEASVNQDPDEEVMFVADLGMSQNSVRDQSESRTSERDVVISGRVETLSSQSEAENLLLGDGEPLVYQDDDDDVLFIADLGPSNSLTNVPLVQQVEQSNMFVGYQPLTSDVNMPPMTVREYQKSLTGEYQLLPPGSDDEDATYDGQRDDTEEPVSKRPRRTDFRLEPEPLANQDNEDDVMFVADLGVSENPARNESESRTSERDVVISERVDTFSSQGDAQNLRIRDEPENAVNAVISIVPLVQQMEGRARSVGYLTLQAVVNAPPMTEAEYLKSLPGHDQVLCPDSDEEDAT